MSSDASAVPWSRRARRRRGTEAVPQAVGSPRVDWSGLDPADLMSPSLYINRELSWLEFNQRVLAQAQDPSHPLLERVKFLAIAGTNLDEFFMVRVATLLKKFRAGIDEISLDGLDTEDGAGGDPQPRAGADRRAVDVLVAATPAAARGRRHPLPRAERLHARDRHVADAVLQGPDLPGADAARVRPRPSVSVHLEPAARTWRCVVRHGGRTKFARVKVPDMLPRFVPLPAGLAPHGGTAFVFLEDVIRRNIQELFPGTQVEGAHLFRVVRDTDMVIQEDEADDLLETVDRGLKQLRYGALSLLQVEAGHAARAC